MKTNDEETGRGVQRGVMEEADVPDEDKAKPASKQQCLKRRGFLTAFLLLGTICIAVMLGLVFGLAVKDDDEADSSTVVQAPVSLEAILDAANTSWSQLGRDIGQGQVNLGWKLALSGNGKVLAAGMVFFAQDRSDYTGAVQVFQWTEEESWEQMGPTIMGQLPCNDFGSSVSLNQDGTILAAGSRYKDDDCATMPVEPKIGQVSVYQWNGDTSTWTQRGKDIGPMSEGHFSANNVALSGDGNIVAFADPREIVLADMENRPPILIPTDTEAPTERWERKSDYPGHVHVFDWNGETWNEIGQQIEGKIADNHFGRALALSSDGRSVAAGASGSDWTNRDDYGYASVYRRNGEDDSWEQIGDDLRSNITNDFFGLAVSLSKNGEVVAVGAPFNDFVYQAGGYTRVFRLVDASWQQLGDDIVGEKPDGRFGSSISMSSGGTILAIGGWLSGVVRFCAWNETRWVPIGGDIEALDSGLSLSEDGTMVAVGGSGTIRVYQLVLQ